MSYTYYDYLELPPGASPAQIEARYVALLERFGYGTTDAGQDMSGLVRMIHAAYEVLSNPDARRSYDAALAQEAAMADAELKASLDQQATAGAACPEPSGRAAERVRGDRRLTCRAGARLRGRPDFNCIQRCGRQPLFSRTGAPAARPAHGPRRTERHGSRRRTRRAACDETPVLLGA